MRIGIVLCACVVGALLTGSGGALAGSGGTAVPGGGGDGDQPAARTTYQQVPFGSRTLRRGHRGDDVKTLNWILKSRPFARRVPWQGEFKGTTAGAVRRIQRQAEIRASGVVQKQTRTALARGMWWSRATWYGPGLWGNRTACGQRLRPATLGVAHKTLACGTRVIFNHRGHWARARVIDRGPYRRGFSWDLTKRTAQQLGFLSVGVGRVKAAVVR